MRKQGFWVEGTDEENTFMMLTREEVDFIEPLIKSRRLGDLRLWAWKRQARPVREETQSIIESLI